MEPGSVTQLHFNGLFGLRNICKLLGSTDEHFRSFGDLVACFWSARKVKEWCVSFRNIRAAWIVVEDFLAKRRRRPRFPFKAHPGKATVSSDALLGGSAGTQSKRDEVARRKPSREKRVAGRDGDIPRRKSRILGRATAEFNALETARLFDESDNLVIPARHAFVLRGRRRRRRTRDDARRHGSKQQRNLKNGSHLTTFLLKHATEQSILIVTDKTHHPPRK